MKTTTVIRYIIFILFCFFGVCSFGQTNPLIDSIRTRISGPFMITIYDSMQVFVKIDRLYWSKDLDTAYPETDLSFAIIDNKGQELFRKSYPYSYTFEIFITPSEFNIPGKGKTLFLMFEKNPSCCYAGEGQIYGVNQLGYFVAMTGLVRLGRMYDDHNYFKPKYINPSNTTIIKNQEFDGSKLFLEQYHTGGSYQFLTMYDYNEFYPEGIFSDLYDSDHQNMEIIPMDFDLKGYQEHRANEENIEPQEIVLHNFTQSGLVIPRPVLFKINSTIKVMELKNYMDTYWLHVKIDGIEGYIIEDDFEKMCFHESD